MKTLMSLLLVLFCTSLYADTFKKPESGTKFKIKYTVEIDGEFKDRTEEITYLTSTDETLVINDADGKKHILPRTYVNTAYRHLFFESDWKKYQKKVGASKMLKENREKAKVLIDKLSVEEKKLLVVLQSAYLKYGKHLTDKARKEKAYLGQFKGQAQVTAMYRQTLADIANLRARKVSLAMIGGYTLKYIDSVKVKQVIDTKSAIVEHAYKYHDLKQLYNTETKEDYYMLMDTAGYVDGGSYKLNKYFYHFGTKTYRTLAGSRTIKSFKSIEPSMLNKVYQIFKMHNGLK